MEDQEQHEFDRQTALVAMARLGAMEFVDLECTHDVGKDQALWMHNAVLDPDEPGIHMLGSSIEWLVQHWPDLDADAARQTLRVPAPGERIMSPSGERVLVLDPSAERIELALIKGAAADVKLQDTIVDGAITSSDEGRKKIDQAYIFAGFSADGSVVFVEHHVMNYEERYARDCWDYQFREIRRDEWDAVTGALKKRERVSQY